jgi:hypothetical protein
MVGGLAGLASIDLLKHPTTIRGAVILGLAALAFAMSFLAGYLLLIGKPLGESLTFWLQASQVPAIQSPVLSYSWFSGLSFAMLWEGGGNLTFRLGAGGAFTLQLGSDSPLTIGLNLVAIFVVYHFAGPKGSTPRTVIHTPPEGSA